MTVGGWVTMISSLVFVWGLAIWCFRKVLATPQEEKAPIGFGP
jgi:NADH:ubiquinone oxidoreductase subunit H